MTYENEIKQMEEYTYQWNADNYDNEDEPILKITKSSMMSHLWCPKKYEFGYIQRLPQDQSEAMRKGTIMHNAREDFFNDFDIAKAENMAHDELVDYCVGLFPIDDYFDEYITIAAFEANRFSEAKAEDKLTEFLPACNEGLLDCEIIIDANTDPKYPLRRDYKVHLQGIIDRVFREGDGYIPMEFKTGKWSDGKMSSMRKEMAFYKLMIDNSSEAVLRQAGLEPNLDVTHWSWYYPISNFIHVEKVKKTSMTSVLKSIARLIHAYERKLFPAKFFYKTCAHCSYFGICEAAQEDTWL
jgi:hypothetical protein